MNAVLHSHPRGLRGRHLETTLRDGSTVAVRPIRPADAAALQRLHRRLSELSIHQRYFTALPELSDAMAQHFAQADDIDRGALVALDPERPGEILALAQYEREPGTQRAELAIVIEDRWQGRGLGLALTRLLVARARERGLRTLYGLVQAQNVGMQRLLDRLGLPVHRSWDAGVVWVELELARRESVAEVQQRDLALAAA